MQSSSLLMDRVLVKWTTSSDLALYLRSLAHPGHRRHSECIPMWSASREIDFYAFSIDAQDCFVQLGMLIASLMTICPNLLCFLIYHDLPCQHGTRAQWCSRAQLPSADVWLQ